MIFNSFSASRYSLYTSIQTDTKSVDMIEASTLVLTTAMTSSPKQMILQRKIEEFDMDRIADHLHIDGLESCINAGADQLKVGEFIISYPQELKSHLVASNC